MTSLITIRTNFCCQLQDRLFVYLSKAASTLSSNQRKPEKMHRKFSDDDPRQIIEDSDWLVGSLHSCLDWRVLLTRHVDTQTAL